MKTMLKVMIVLVILGSIPFKVFGGDAVVIDNFEKEEIKNWWGAGVKKEDFSLSEDCVEGKCSLKIYLALDYTPRIFIYKELEEPVDVSPYKFLVFSYKLSSANLHPSAPFLIRFCNTGNKNYCTIWQIKKEQIKPDKWEKVYVKLLSKEKWKKDFDPCGVFSICFRLEAAAEAAPVTLFLDEIEFLTSLPGGGK